MALHIVENLQYCLSSSVILRFARNSEWVDKCLRVYSTNVNEEVVQETLYCRVRDLDPCQDLRDHIDPCIDIYLFVIIHEVLCNFLQVPMLKDETQQPKRVLQNEATTFIVLEPQRDGLAEPFHGGVDVLVILLLSILRLEILYGFEVRQRVMVPRLRVARIELQRFLE